MHPRSSLAFSLALALAGAACGAQARKVAPPPNAPAEARWDGHEGRLVLRYHGTVILDATVTAEDARGRGRERVAVGFKPVETLGEKVEQRLGFALERPDEGVTVLLRGKVIGSGEAFPAETASEAQKRFPCVRKSVGLSCNLRNNAVYDRRWDWVLVGPPDGRTRIAPEGARGHHTVFSWESRGAPLELIFRPRFYQKHKGLAYYEPWTYEVWKGSVTGYCTWWAYKAGFSQERLDEIVDVFSEKHLPDFGYRYLQFDNCYQTGGGSPEGFLKWNGKFPGGPRYAVKRIRSAGMEPGIWVFCVFKAGDRVVRGAAAEHPEWFVRKPDGGIFTTHGWYALDPTDQDALERLVRPTYRGLKQLGFSYVKIDGAGDLFDWGYRKCPEYFMEKGLTPEDASRRLYQAARRELGRDVYILSCWGVLPQLIGVVDGCRLATDGFRAASFQGFTSWGGVVWRNDPDHCDILPVGRRQETMETFAVQDAPVDSVVRPSVVSMAGGVLMLSDKVEVYRDPRNLEGIKRSAPVLFTVPGQLYDFTPPGPRWFFRNHARGGGGEACWWLLEIDRPFDHWSVLARFNWPRKKLGWKRRAVPAQEVRFADLGLAQDRAYLVFEFWRQEFLGRFTGAFTAPAQDESNGLQVFAIRRDRPHPWVISTTRHISQGGVSLLEEKWDGRSKVLSGRSAVVVGDPHVLTVHLPEGFHLDRAEVTGEKAHIAEGKETATIRIVPSATKTVDWRLFFARTVSARRTASRRTSDVQCRKSQSERRYR